MTDTPTPTCAAEVKRLAEAAEAAGRTLTADAVVEAARDAEGYPALHKHLWATDIETLAMEARRARAHRVIMSIRIVTEEGSTARVLVHTRGVPGYQPVSAVVAVPDLARAKVAEIRDRISRLRGDLATFRGLLPPEIAAEIDQPLAEAESRATARASAQRLVTEVEATAA